VALNVTIITRSNEVKKRMIMVKFYILLNSLQYLKIIHFKEVFFIWCFKKRDCNVLY